LKLNFTKNLILTGKPISPGRPGGPGGPDGPVGPCFPGFKTTEIQI